MAIAIKISNITKKYGRKYALKNVSFNINSGEVFGLLGPNGAGKTTLIKIITGLMNIEEGSIEILGFNLEKEHNKAIENVGAIVENPEMYKHLTGRQNIMQFARMRNNITPERIEEVIELVGLTNRINERVSKYSLGMRQRLGVALALLHNPKVLILDEPTNGLDPAGIKQLRDIITNIAHKNDVCVMVSSHLISEMQLMCDRVAILDKGVLIKVDSIDNLTTNAEDHKTTYTLDTDNNQKAIEIINSLSTDYNPTVDNDKLIVSVITGQKKDCISNINASLVKNDIAVYEITPIESTSLEDAFISITNGGGDQIA